MASSRQGPAVFVAVLMATLFLAHVPAFEQPGRTAREVLLLVSAPLLLAWSLTGATRRPSWLFLGSWGIVGAAGIAGVLAAPSIERISVLRDLAVLAAPWAVCIAAAVRCVGAEAEEWDTWIERGAVFALLVTGWIGLGQGWFGWSILEQTRPPAGTFVNRNVAAQALILAIPLATPAVLAGRTAAARWLAGLGAGVGLGFLMATRSRGAWFGLAAGVLVAMLAAAISRWSPRLRGAKGPAAVVLGFVLLGAVVPVSVESGKIVSVGGAIRSLGKTELGAIRVPLWRNTVAMTLDTPFTGIGAGRFAVEYPRYHRAVMPTPKFGTEQQPEHAHGDLLEYAAELGIPAALALLVLLVGAAWASATSVGDGERSGDERLRAAARVAALVAACAHSLVSFPLHSPASAFVLWLLVGRSWADTSRDKPPIVGARIGAALLIGVTLLAASVCWRDGRAQATLGSALEAYATGDCSTAQSLAAEVKRHAPWRRRDTGIAAMVVFECDRSPEGSLPALESALAANPNQVNLLLAVGARRIKAGRHVEAETCYHRVIDILPDHGGAWLGVAMARVYRGDLSGASEACTRAIALDDGPGPTRTFCVGNRLVRP